MRIRSFFTVIATAFMIEGVMTSLALSQAGGAAGMGGAGAADGNPALGGAAGGIGGLGGVGGVGGNGAGVGVLIASGPGYPGALKPILSRTASGRRSSKRLCSASTWMMVAICASIRAKRSSLSRLVAA
jgi:hypothetical protein